MKKEELKQKLQRIAATLCATKMRIDQAEATERIRACVRELLDVIDGLDEEEQEE